MTAIADRENIIHKLKDYLESRELHALRDLLIVLPPADIAELLVELSVDDRAVIFRILPRDTATEVFEFLPTDSQSELLTSLGTSRIAVLLSEMAADDRTALFEEMPAIATRQLLDLLPKEDRSQALSLLGYPESSVGRLMSPDYVSVKQDWPIWQVFTYIREHGKESDSLNVVYVVDDKGKLTGEIRTRDLLIAATDRKVSHIMSDKLIPLSANDDQEKAVQAFTKYGRTVLPVVDSNGIILGIVTVDDVLEVAEEEATEDIQKFGGSEALDEPYLKAPFMKLIRTRATWLVVLFLGEMLTATAMAFFSDEISKAVVLALFIPLIISSGGNSGSQAATLVIRALSIGEIQIKDWLKVLKRELASGVFLGGLLGIIGFFRVIIWSFFSDIYAGHELNIGLVVMISLTGVVLWGTVTGSMLPFVLKKLGADPAASSAPFVATLVDVVGLIIYFSVAAIIMGEMLK